MASSSLRSSCDGWLTLICSCRSGTGGADMMRTLDFLREHAVTLPLLAKFAIAMAVIVGVPPLARRAHFPIVVGLLLTGVVIGPHGLDVAGQNRPVAEFFAELGAL